MPLIEPVGLDAANAEQKKILEGIQAKMGKIPNIYATMARSPSTLEAALAYNAGLKKGVLTPKEIEAIALAVAQANDCDYCLAAHTVIGKMSGLTPEEIMESRLGKSSDQKMDSLVKLAVEIVRTNGQPRQKTIETCRKEGYGDAALVEIIAWVAYDIFTNYFNHIAQTKSDFPPAPAIN